MAVTTFAATDIGSYEVSMKIFEMSKRIGFREINDVRYQLELGRGTYAAGRLEMETVDELCDINPLLPLNPASKRLFRRVRRSWISEEEICRFRSLTKMLWC